MQNLVVVSHAVCAHVGGTKKFLEGGRWGPAPWDGAGRGWLPRNTLVLHVCFRTRFRRCMSTRLGVRETVPKMLGRWDPALLGWGVADP